MSADILDAAETLAADARAYRDARAAYRAARAAFLELVGECAGESRIGPITVRVVEADRVDYERAALDAGIDLEPYRYVRRTARIGLTGGRAS